MKDKDVVLMLAVPVIVKAMSNKNLLKLGALSWEVGIWNEGVGGGGDDGVWISVDIKNVFSIGLFGITEEKFKEVLKCWRHGT